MLQLIYTSIAAAPMSRPDMKALCQQAARNNETDEITGILLIKDRHFVQAIEGPKEVVENTFLRIIVDRRHTSLLLLARRMITKRFFGEWSMTLCEGDDQKRAAIEKVRSVIVDAPQALRAQFDAVFPASTQPQSTGVIHPRAGSAGARR